MVRRITWLVLGCFTLAVTGCGGGGSADQAANNNPPAPAPAPAGPPPGMAAGGPPGMAPPAGGAAGMVPPGAPGVPPAGGAAAAAPTAAAGPAKDPLVYLPGNVTFAVGGLPSAVVKSTNKVAGSFLAQFSPLTMTLAKIGLPPQEFESFWAAGTADLAEQALCVVTAADINQDAVKQAVGEANIPKDSRVWPLPGDLSASHAIAIADSRTIIVGRRSTVEAALRKSPALVIRQGLATINQVDSDFWMAGDSPAAQTYFSSGLPLLGSYRKSFKDLKAFAVGMILEGKTLTPPPSASTGGGGGAAAMGMMGGGVVLPGPGQGPAAGPAGYAAMAGSQGGIPGAPGTGTAAAASTEQNGVSVQVGLVFESDTVAIAIKEPLDAFLTASARRMGPKSPRFVPDLFGGGGSSNSGGPAGMAAQMSAYKSGGPPPGYPAPAGAGAAAAGGAYPMPNGGGGGAPAGSSVPVVQEPAPAGSAAPPDPHLALAPPPPAQVVSDTPPAADAAAAAPAAGAPGAPGGYGPPPGTVVTQPPGYGQAPANYGKSGPAGMAMAGMAGYPGMNGGGAPAFGGFAGQWITQQGAIVQFSYRFDARDENVAFASHLLRALGVYSFGGSLSTTPLAALHKASEQWSGAGAASSVKLAKSYGPEGAGWMINLLPYLGHEALYKRFDFNKPLSDTKNAKLTHSIIPEFLNPADPRQQWTGTPYAGMGLTHYVGMSGVEEDNGPPAAILPRNDPKAGIFGYSEIAKPEMITDGQSQTIMMVGSGELASPWSVGGGATIRGARPNSFSTHGGFGSAGGPKPGAYVLFADGSVRFVAADVDPQVFRAMSTTHGKDTVDLPGLQSSGTVAGK